MQLFNKQDQFKCHSFFNENDVGLIESIGLYVAELFGSHSAYKKIQKKYQKFQKIIEDKENLQKKANTLKKRTKIFGKLLNHLDKHSVIDENLVFLMREAMDCKLASIFFCKDKNASLLQSTNPQEASEGILGLVEYTCYAVQKTLNIKNLKASPLSSQNKSSGLNSCLFVPLKLASGQELVLALMRESKEFTTFDITYSDKIKEKFENLNSIIANSSKQSYKDLDNITRFSISLDSSLYNFYELFSIFKKMMIGLMSLSSCSVYVADQICDKLYTVNSNSSNTIFLPYSSQTLLGTCYYNKEPIIFSSSVDEQFTDSHIYYGKKTLAMPILSENFENPVLGIILLVRLENDFIKKDLNTAKFYANALGGILESLYILNLDKLELNLPIPPNVYSRIVESVKKVHLDDSENLKNPGTRHGKVNQVAKNLIEFCVGTSATIENLKKVVGNVAEFGDFQRLCFGICEIAGCEKSLVALVKDFHFNMVDANTNQDFVADECMILSMVDKKPCFVDSQSQTEGFSKLNSVILPFGAVKNLLMVPVLNFASTVIGLLFMGNFKVIPNSNQIKDLNLLGSVSGLLYSNSEPKLWQHINESKNNEFKLNKWLKIIYKVKKLCISNLIRCKNLSLNLKLSQSFEELSKSTIQIISCIANSTECVLKLHSTNFSAKLSNDKFITKLPIKSIIKIQSLHNKPATTLRKNEKYELIIPFKHKKTQGVFKIKNVNCEFSNEFINDTASIISEIQNFCLLMTECFLAYPEDQMENKQQLLEYAKILALKYKPTALYISIQKGVKDLMDCEHGLLVLKSDEKIVIPEQKYEFFVPENFVLEENSGIFNSVLMSGETEIVENAYEDSRFDNRFDTLTGYHTVNFICCPLIYNNQKIGAIQGINKVNGKFSQNDLENILSFSEQVSMKIDFIQNIQNSLEEQIRLISIYESMDKYIAIFNKKGFMVYANVNTEEIFPGTFEDLRLIEYFKWIPYSELVDDIYSVLENSKETVKKFSQKFTNYKQNNEIIQVNYSISTISFFSLNCISGAILVIEKSLIIDNLYKDFKSIHQSVRNKVSPLSIKTELQNQIEELKLISNLQENQEIKVRIDDIVNCLQNKDLLTQKLEINYKDATIDAVASMLELPNDLNKIGSSMTNDILDDLLLESTPTISLEELRNWDLNPFLIENHFDYIIAMLKEYSLISKYHIDYTNLMNFLTKVEQGYSTYNNPFHNFMHGFNVMHGIYMLLSCTPASTYFRSHQILALLIASLCHDLGHRGRSNTFEVNNRTLIANTHHDESVLERHHAAMTFIILNEDNSNILENLNRKKYMAIRKLIILAILSTDMTKHLKIIEDNKNRFLQLDAQKMGAKDNDIETLTGLMIHCSDLLHPCKSFEIYEIWSILVSQEFTDQYNEEVKLDLPITTFFKDLDKPVVYYSNEIGFLGYIVKPLWECLQMFLSPDIDKLLRNLDENIEIMKKKKENWINVGNE